MSEGAIEDTPELELNEHQRAIARYYKECWLDYRLFWMNKRNLGMHFGWWDEKTRNHAHSLLRTNEVMADRVDIGPGDRVLDAGCGVGGSCIYLATMRGATVVGVDLSSDQIRLARGFVRKRAVEDRVTLVQRDYLHTGLPQESFDVVWACETLSHTPDQREFLAEAYRLLKPGGWLIVRDVYQNRPPADAEEKRLMHDALSAWAMPDHLPAIEQFLGWLSQAGFTEVDAEDVRATGVRSMRRLYWMCLTVRPGATLLNRVGLRSDVQHANVTGPIAAWHGYRRGLWTAFHTAARRPVQVTPDRAARDLEPDAPS